MQQLFNSTLKANLVDLIIKNIKTGTKKRTSSDLRNVLTHFSSIAFYLNETNTNSSNQYWKQLHEFL